MSPLSHLGSQMPAGSSKDDQIIVDDSPPVSSNTRSKTAGRTADLDDHMKELTKICEDKNVGQQWTPGRAEFKWNDVFPQSDLVGAGGLWAKYTALLVLFACGGAPSKKGLNTHCLVARAKPAEGKGAPSRNANLVLKEILKQTVRNQRGKALAQKMKEVYGKGTKGKDVWISLQNSLVALLQDSDDYEGLGEMSRNIFQGADFGTSVTLRNHGLMGRVAVDVDDSALRHKHVLTTISAGRPAGTRMAGAGGGLSCQESMRVSEVMSEIQSEKTRDMNLREPDGQAVVMVLMVNGPDQVPQE